VKTVSPYWTHESHDSKRIRPDRTEAT